MQIITDRSQALTVIRTDLGAIRWFGGTAAGYACFAKTLEETRFCWPKIAPTPSAAEPCAAAKGSTGGCRSERGGRRQQAERGIVNRTR